MIGQMVNAVKDLTEVKKQLIETIKELSLDFHFDDGAETAEVRSGFHLTTRWSRPSRSCFGAPWDDRAIGRWSGTRASCTRPAVGRSRGG